ncbi:MAG: cation:proton antiporter [Myxococcota bacterium]|nr:cation:proton antiporter [Myxococcota bacterium]
MSEPVMSVATTLFLLLIVASAVAMIARRLKLPYTVTLVMAGLALGAVDERSDVVSLDAVRLTPELLFDLFLPALLFEAAFHLSWPKFKKNLRAVLLLAVPGVAAAIAIAGGLAFYLEPLAEAPLPLMVAFLFVAMCAATDPVSVVALFKELGVPKRLAVLMEGESLLNDGVAVVAFIVLGAVLGIGQHGEPVTAWWAARFLLWEIFVGLAIGVGVGLLVSYVTTLVSDHLVEIMLTTIAAFGSYLVADVAHASPVLAVVAAGMATGNVGARFGLTPTNKIAVESFWEYAVFAANSFVFLLLGKEIDLSRMFSHWAAILIAWAALMAARAVVIFSVDLVLKKSKERLPERWPVVLVWGGLRGSLSMVLALSLPEDFAQRDLLIDLTFGVVLVSILVQGLSMSSVLKWAGAVEGGAGHREYMRLRGAMRATREALHTLDGALAAGEIRQETHDRLRAQLSGREAELEMELENVQADTGAVLAKELETTAERLLEAERKAVEDAERSGVIDEPVARALLEDIDARLVALHATGVDAAGPEPEAS